MRFYVNASCLEVSLQMFPCRWLIEPDKNCHVRVRMLWKELLLRGMTHNTSTLTQARQDVVRNALCDWGSALSNVVFPWNQEIHFLIRSFSLSFSRQTTIESNTTGCKVHNQPRKVLDLEWTPWAWMLRHQWQPEVAIRYQSVAWMELQDRNSSWRDNHRNFKVLLCKAAGKSFLSTEFAKIWWLCKACSSNHTIVGNCRT